MYIYYKIRLRPVSKKNSMQVAKTKAGIPFIVQSKAYKKYEKGAKEYLRPLGKPIDTAVNVKCTYWLHKNKDGSIPKTKVDLTNLLGATDDILVKYKILADDNCQIVASHDGSRVYYTNENEECTEIEISDYF